MYFILPSTADHMQIISPEVGYYRFETSLAESTLSYLLEKTDHYSNIKRNGSFKVDRRQLVSSGKLTWLNINYLARYVTDTQHSLDSQQ